jgi:hypothetical protein
MRQAGKSVKLAPFGYALDMPPSALYAFQVSLPASSPLESPRKVLIRDPLPPSGNATGQALHPSILATDRFTWHKDA